MTDPKTEESPQRRLAQHLTLVLADSYLLYHTTQFCHWNVVGKQFWSLHQMFEEQYRALGEAIDVIAERIRILGFYTPGTLGDYVTISGIEQPSRLHEPDGLLGQLIAGHDAVAMRILDAIPVAQRSSDEATLDLLVERLRAHEKAAWMLKSQAGREFEHLELGKMGRNAAGSPRLARAAGA